MAASYGGWALLRKVCIFHTFLHSLITAASRTDPSRVMAGSKRRDTIELRGDVAGDSDSVPRRHGDAQRVASTIATAGAAEHLLKVEQFGVPRSAVLQQRGGNVSPSSACRTARDDHMPWAQIIEP
jgi:hypothetical protein